MNELCFMSNLSSNEWASWVQAVGSIAAIVAAGLIARQQGRQARRERLAADAARCAAIARLLVRLRDSLRVAHTELFDHERYPAGHVYDGAELVDRALRPLLALPLEAAPGEAAIDALLEAREHVEPMVPQLRVATPLNPGTFLSSRCTAAIDRLTGAISQLRIEAEHLMDGKSPRHAAALNGARLNH